MPGWTLDRSQVRRQSWSLPSAVYRGELICSMGFFSPLLPCLNVRLINWCLNRNHRCCRTSRLWLEGFNWSENVTAVLRSVEVKRWAVRRCCVCPSVWDSLGFGGLTVVCLSTFWELTSLKSEGKKIWHFLLPGLTYELILLMFTCYTKNIK